MSRARLPDEGPVRLGPVTLPAGKPIVGNQGTAVAWATENPVPDSGRVWAALSELYPDTGLVPVQLDGLRMDTFVPGARQGMPDEALRPWDNGEFTDPEDPRGADGMDVDAVLRELWLDSVPFPSDDDAEAVLARAPFGLEFPGLAARESTPLTVAERQFALDVALPRIRVARGATAISRIGLVAADRPADVLPIVGWAALASRGESVLSLVAVLRSWEDRFGAQLIDVGFADLRLLVERPPRTMAAAERVAAEHFALADESTGNVGHIGLLAASLVDAPIWTLWWD
jgi:hypothetical protein